ncbi:MAG TPA: HU family DNA-binding protein [Gemmataceae bacterium]|nr:HU family DNA-binding protein [Gemmataceae bacterium]
MRARCWAGLLVLVGTMGLMLGLAGPAQSQRPQPRREEGLPQRLARDARLTEEQANRFLNALGPAVKADLAAGRTVSIPGLGTFRVVRIEAHRDMAAGGRPVVIPATNTVEFLASSELAGAANSPSAVPAESVPPFQFIPLPGQTPGQKVGRTAVPSTRVR